jgi:hypothetical protein
MHIPMQQGTETACISSQGLTQVDDIREVMRNDASCNEVIQSKKVVFLGPVLSFINGQKEIDLKNADVKSDAVHELEKLLKNLTPAKLKALQALLNMDG